MRTGTAIFLQLSPVTQSLPETGREALPLGRREALPFGRRVQKLF